MIGLLAASAVASPALFELPVDATVVRGIVTESTTTAGPRGLHTTFRVAVEEVLAGPPLTEAVIRLPGGATKDASQRVVDLPWWRVGDDVIACVAPSHTPLLGQFRVVGGRLEPHRPGWPDTVRALEDLLSQTHR